MHAIFSEAASKGPLAGSGEGISRCLDLCECLRSSALMALRSGDSKKAMDRLIRAIGKPALIHDLVRNAIHSSSASVIWDGLRLRIWNDGDLENLSVIFEGIESKENLLNAIRFEAAYGMEILNDPRKYREEVYGVFVESGPANRLAFWLAYEGPSGWRSQRKDFLVNSFLDLTEKMISRRQLRWQFHEEDGEQSVSAIPKGRRG